MIEEPDWVPSLCSTLCLEEWLMFLPETGWKIPPESLSGDKRLVTDEHFCINHITDEAFRSRPERGFAWMLRGRCIPYSYEPVTLVFNDKVYTPDFRLLDTGHLIEVKGAWGMSQKTKLISLRGAMPDIPLIVVPPRLAVIYGRQFS